MPKVRVNLKERNYDIIIGSGILSDFDKIFNVAAKLASPTKSRASSAATKLEIVIITDPLVYSLYGKYLPKAKVIKVPQGEEYKTLEQASKIYDQLIEWSIHRDAWIIALGGGVVGDLAGFVAATYLRGVNLVQIPTTLLAQVDASIGGKTAVNHKKGKNLIGAFYQPKMVIIDTLTLKTLPEKEIRNGLAEIVKYGVIADANLFRFLEDNSSEIHKHWDAIITCCAQIKARVVAKDEKELTGLRMILNYGHTLGHALETLTAYKKISHGEAVSIGMVAAANLAVKMKMFLQVDANRIKNLLEDFGLPTKIPNIPQQEIVKSLILDKKVRDGKVRFVLPRAIGKVEVRDDVPLKWIFKSN